MHLPGAHTVARNIARNAQQGRAESSAAQPNGIPADLTTATHHAHPSDGSSSASSNSDEQQDFTREDTEWQDVGDEEGEELTYIGLFDNEKYSSLEDMLQHTREKHGVDIKGVIKQLGG